MYHKVLGYLNTNFFQIFWGYFTEYGKWVFVIESSVVITRSNIVRYYINNYMNCGRISIICRINKRHPISRPNGPAMGCLLCIVVRKLTALLRHRTVSHFRGCKQDTSFCGVTCISNYMMAPASTMRIHSLISEKKLYFRSSNIGTPSANLQPHENSFGELVKCNETSPGIGKFYYCNSHNIFIILQIPP